MMAKLEAAMSDNAGPTPKDLTETEHNIPMRDGHQSSVRIYKSSSGSPGPLVALAFGGGFVGGSNNQFVMIARPLVRLLGATVVSISYRLAPENKFPAGQLDAWDSMKWIADNATGDLLKADPSKGFIMGGVSAGGSLTSCLSRKFQEEPIAHPLTGQWLCIASTMGPARVPDKYRDHHISASQMARGAGFTKETRDILKTLVEYDESSDLRYAVNSTTSISGQPRTYFQVDGMDPLRDDGLIYDEMLKEAGVETKIDLYPGCPHGHMHGFHGLEITDRANVDTIVGIGWLLGKELGRDQAAEALGVGQS